jgi:hypothetical protein
MPYIGKTPLTGAYQLCDTITTSATATYNLTVGSSPVIPGAAQNCIVSLNGVVQAPVSAYTVSGSTITFSSTLSATDVINFILILGNVFDIGKPTDGSVTNASVASNAAIALSKLATTGTMTFASTIGVGGATPAASGAGITFPASVSASTDANTLDDYEEGTWTPILGGEGTNTGQTYTSQVGRYTKIGNRVYISGYVKLSVLGTLGGTYAAIKSLPFTSNASSSLATGTVAFSYALNFASNVQSLGAYVTTSDTLFYICGSATTGVSPLNNLAKAVIGASTELAFAGHYIV